MKPLFWVGLVLLILGLASLVIAVPRNEREGIKVGGVSVGVEPGTTKRRHPLLVR